MSDIHTVRHPETGEQLFHYEWCGWWWCENEQEAFDWETGTVVCPHCGDTFEAPPPTASGSKPEER